MPSHAYRCECGRRLEIQYLLSEYPYPEEVPCHCGKQLVRFFERAPGIAPDIWHPYYDNALGAVVTSRKQRERVAREKGFEIMGPEEHKRSYEAAKPKEDFELSPQDKLKLRDSAEKAWNDIQYGNVPVDPPPAVDTADAIVVES